MIFAHQIREVINKYVSGLLDSDGFLLAFAPLSSAVHVGRAPEALRLVNLVEAHLAEARSGCCSESQLRQQLQELCAVGSVNSLIMELSFPVAVNQYLRPERAFPEPFGASGTSHEVVFGSAASLLALSRTNKDPLPPQQL